MQKLLADLAEAPHVRWLTVGHLRPDLRSHGSIRYVDDLDYLALLFTHLAKAEGEVEVDKSELEEPLALRGDPLVFRCSCGIIVGELDGDVVKADVPVNDSHLVKRLKRFGQFLHDFESVTDLVILRLVEQGGQVPSECLLVLALDQVGVALLVCEAVDKLGHHLGLEALL